MTGYVTLLNFLLLLSTVSSQITFSRTWVRGKYPGEGEVGGDEDNQAFVRGSKAAAMEGFGLEEYSSLPRFQKYVLEPNINTRPRPLKPVFRKWKHPNSFSKFKDQETDNALSMD